MTKETKEQNEVMSAKRSGCPCTIVAPCSPNCSCAAPSMSGGCLRCAKYGSEEQRRAAAVRLASMIEPSAEPTEGVTKAARALVDALDRCKPGLDGLAVLAYVHWRTYAGPTFGVELEALRAALARVEEEKP